MKKKIRVREARWEDLPGILEVENKAWPEKLRANRQVYEFRLKTFPEGLLIAEADGKIEGVVVTQKVSSEVADQGRSWNEITDGGRIKKTHNPRGNTLYGVNLSVFSRAPRGVATALLEAIGKKAIINNIKQIVLGARIPGFKRYFEEYCHQHRLSHLSEKQKDEIAEEYIKTFTPKGKPLDPEINFYYTKAGTSVLKLLPNYIEDPESLNYGVLLVWKNPFYNRPLPKLWNWLFFQMRTIKKSS